MRESHKSANEKPLYFKFQVTPINFLFIIALSASFPPHCKAVFISFARFCCSLLGYSQVKPIFASETTGSFISKVHSNLTSFAVLLDQDLLRCIFCPFLFIRSFTMKEPCFLQILLWKKTCSVPFMWNMASQGNTWMQQRHLTFG